MRIYVVRVWRENMLLYHVADRLTSWVWFAWSLEISATLRLCFQPRKGESENKCTAKHVGFTAEWKVGHFWYWLAEVKANFKPKSVWHIVQGDDVMSAFLLLQIEEIRANFRWKRNTRLVCKWHSLLNSITMLCPCTIYACGCLSACFTKNGGVLGLE